MLYNKSFDGSTNATFQMIIFAILFNFARNMDCWCFLELPLEAFIKSAQNLRFWIEIKNNVYPRKPYFSPYKVMFFRVFIAWSVNVMISNIRQCEISSQCLHNYNHLADREYASGILIEYLNSSYSILQNLLLRYEQYLGDAYGFFFLYSVPKGCGNGSPKSVKKILS